MTIKISGNNLISSVKVSCQVQEKQGAEALRTDGRERNLRGERRRGINENRRNS